jgi:hypothetical protein
LQVELRDNTEYNNRGLKPKLPKNLMSGNTSGTPFRKFAKQIKKADLSKIEYSAPGTPLEDAYIFPYCGEGNWQNG